MFVGILNLPLPSESRARDPHRVDGNNDGFGLVGQDISRCDVGDSHGDIPLDFGLADKKTGRFACPSKDEHAKRAVFT